MDEVPINYYYNSDVHLAFIHHQVALDDTSEADIPEEAFDAIRKVRPNTEYVSLPSSSPSLVPNPSLHASFPASLPSSRRGSSEAAMKLSEVLTKLGMTPLDSDSEKVEEGVEAQETPNGCYSRP
jgi:hypothetical protein